MFCVCFSTCEVNFIWRVRLIPQNQNITEHALYINLGICYISPDNPESFMWRVSSLLARLGHLAGHRCVNGSFMVRPGVPPSRLCWDHWQQPCTTRMLSSLMATLRHSNDVDSFTVSLHSPNGRHLPAVRAVQGDCQWPWETVRITTGRVSP